MPKIDIEKTGVLATLERVSKSLGGEYTKDIGNGTLFLRNKNGSGKIRAFELAGGISCMAYDIEFKNEINYTIDEKEERHLYFNYVLDGYFDYKIGSANDYRRIGAHQNVIVETDSNLKALVKLPKNIPLRYLTINITNSPNQGAKNVITLLTDELTASFSLGKEKRGYTYFGNYSLDILRTVEEFYALKTSGAIGNILNEALIHKILGHQLEEHELNKNNTSTHGLSSRQSKGVQNAVRYIEKNLSKKHQVDTLAQIARMSNKQLQLAFKKLFQKTVIEFFTERRLEKSRELLLKSDKNISEIAYEMGFSNASYFSELFRKKFDSSPKEYRNLVKNNPS